jgi:hypothetical protein
MIANRYGKEKHDFLMVPEKASGISLVFSEGTNPSDLLIESVINWAKSPYTLGFAEDPYDIEFDAADFGDGLEVSINWAQEVDVIPYEVMNLTSSFLSDEHPDSGCKEIRVRVSLGKKVITH